MQGQGQGADPIKEQEQGPGPGQEQGPGQEPGPEPVFMREQYLIVKHDVFLSQKFLLLLLCPEF